MRAKHRRGHHNRGLGQSGLNRGYAQASHGLIELAGRTHGPHDQRRGLQALVQDALVLAQILQQQLLGTGTTAQVMGGMSVMGVIYREMCVKCRFGGGSLVLFRFGLERGVISS